MRLYLDTNVIVDLLDDRHPASYDLFIRSLLCQHTLVVSSWAVAELIHIGYGQQSDTFLQFLMHNKKVVFVQQDSSDKAKAENVSTHFADAVHYVIAKRCAEGIVTWNWRDFPFTDIIVGTPEDF